MIKVQIYVSILHFLELKKVYKIIQTTIRFAMHLLDVKVMENVGGVLFILYVFIYIYIMLNMVLHIQHLAEHFQKALEQKQDSTQNHHMALQ